MLIKGNQPMLIIINRSVDFFSPCFNLKCNMKGKYLDMRRATQKTHAALIGNLTTTTWSDGEVSEWSSRLQQTRGSDNFFFFLFFSIF